MRVLLGEISSYKAIVIASFIRKYYANIELFSYDSRSFTRFFRTKYIKKWFLMPSPEKDISLHLDELSKVIRQNNIDVFIPVNSSFYGKYIQEKALLNNTFDYTSRFEIYEQMHNKTELALLASLLNIRIPKHFASVSEAICPFVIKPENLSSAKGVKYVFEENKKRRIVLNNQNKIIQEFIPGTGCGYSIFAKEGEILKAAGHLRLAEFPIKGGSSVYRKTFFLEQMNEIATKIIRHLKFSGFAMFEFKLKPEGELVLIEVNPRIWGSINQGLVNGINYFEPIFGPPSTTVCLNSKNTYLAPLLYLSLFYYLIRGNFRPLFLYIKNTYKNSPDVSLLKDPKGYLSIIFRKIL